MLICFYVAVYPVCDCSLSIDCLCTCSFYKKMIKKIFKQRKPWTKFDKIAPWTKFDKIAPWTKFDKIAISNE